MIYQGSLLTLHAYYLFILSIYFLLFNFIYFNYINYILFVYLYNHCIIIICFNYIKF